MRRHSTLALLAWSLVGLIVGHQATYLAVYRDPALMGNVLDATGHGWLWLAPVFMASGVLTALVVGFRGSGSVRSFRWRFAFLALIQMGTFATIEMAERSAGGSGTGHLLEAAPWPILIVGSLIQVGVALILAVASRVVERVAAAYSRVAPTVARRRAGRILTPPRLAIPHGFQPGPGNAPRAPPILA